MINLIAAVARNRVIGKDGDIPWYLPEDLRRFKQFTKEKTIIMGRGTWDSLPKRPLPKRLNIVVTSQYVLENSMSHDTYYTSINMDQAIAIAKRYNQNSEIFIIGGESIYTEALYEDLVDRMYLTYIDKDFEGDRHFPEIDKHNWKWRLEGTGNYEGLIYKFYRADKIQ